MPQSQYVLPTEVALVPGRFLAFWQNMSPAAQSSLINEASAKVDEILGMPDAGILAQTNVSTTIRASSDRDTLFLPAKPITNVRSITVVPLASANSYTLPVVLSPGPGQVATIQIWGGQGLKYTGDPTGQIVIPAWGRVQAPFQEDDTVTVVYDYGYPFGSLPVAIKRATRMILSAMLLSEADNPEGAFMISEDGASHRYGGLRGEINPVEDEARTMLQPYMLEVYNN